MTLWQCLDCGTKFAVGLRLCPQCTSETCTEYREEETVSPKISKANGATHAGGDAGWDGSSSPTSTEKEPTTGDDSSPSDRKPAPTAESPSSSDPASDSSASSTAGTSADQVEPTGYDDWLKPALIEELGKRELSKAGTKAEMIRRLAEYDQLNN